VITRCFREFRHTSRGSLMLPGFGAVYTDTDIGVVANQSRLSSAPSHRATQSIAEYRRSFAQWPQLQPHEEISHVI
jgi:hypothetical protein